MMLKHQELTGRIIQAFYKVYNTLGYGFLEKVYHSALLIELKNRGMAVESKSPIRVYYEGQEIGVYFADILVDNTVILELKALGTLGANEGTADVNLRSLGDGETGHGEFLTQRRRGAENAEERPLAEGMDRNSRARFLLTTDYADYTDSDFL